MVHAALEGAVEVGKCFRTAAKTHALAEVVPALGTEGTIFAHDARLDGNTLARLQMLDAWTDCGNNASCFVAKNQWCLQCEVAVPALQVIVHYTWTTRQ